MKSGIISMNSTESGLLVTAKITAPISSGATIMMYGNGLSSGRLGPAGTTRLGSSKRGTTRGDRLKFTRGDVGAAAWLCPSGTTVTVVSPRVTVSEELSVARVTGSPSIKSPFAELVSTISTPSPTVMRAWRLDVSGSERRMSTSRSRPI
jgi:hypothetical protein